MRLSRGDRLELIFSVKDAISWLLKTLDLFLRSSLNGAMWTWNYRLTSSESVEILPRNNLAPHMTGETREHWLVVITTHNSFSSSSLFFFFSSTSAVCLQFHSVNTTSTAPCNLRLQTVEIAVRHKCGTTLVAEPESLNHKGSRASQL